MVAKSLDPGANAPKTTIKSIPEGLNYLSGVGQFGLLGNRRHLALLFEGNK